MGERIDKMPESFSSVFKIAKYTLTDVVRQKSFLVMFALCALLILMTRGCYQGGFMVNGQTMDAESVVRFMSKATFHFIAAAVTLLAGLLSMRTFRRDRDEGAQSFILSKPITRHQYVAGKIMGLWALCIAFMFLLHILVFAMTSIYLGIITPEYLAASLLCSFNLLFVIVTVLLLSLFVPDILAFLSVMGIGMVSLVSEGLFALSHSSMGQAMMRQPGSESGPTGGTMLYYVWPKLSGMQQFASSILSGQDVQGFLFFYPPLNILAYCAMLGALLFWRFGKEDIV